MEAGLKALPKHVAARLQVLMGVTSNLQVWGSVEKRGRSLAGAPGGAEAAASAHP